MINRKLKITLIVLGILALLVNILMIAFEEPNGPKEVKCYDRHNNEIIGEKCLERGGYTSISTFVVFLFLFGMLLGLESY